MKRSVASWAGVLALLAAGPAYAERVVHVENVQILPSLPLEDVITVTPSVGSSFGEGGTFAKGGSDVVTGPGTLFGQSISGATTLTSHSKSFSDVHDQPITMGININYGLSNFDEIYLGFRWYHAASNQFSMMTTSNSITWGGQSIPAGGTIYGQFSDYDEYGLEVGYHHFFDIEEIPGFHPYGGILLGMKRNDNVKLDLRSGTGTIVSSIRYYNAGLVADAGAIIGLRYDVEQLFALGIESGIRYEGPLSPNKVDFQGTGFYGTNSGGDRWDVPVMATVTAKF